jgi:hypothetical protein
MTSSEQARADAMADAETLRLWAASRPMPIDDFDWFAYPAEVAVLRCVVTTDPGGAGLWNYRPETHAEDVCRAARAAFRAVPGLRGE